MNDRSPENQNQSLPTWVPLAAIHYLAHTEDGHSIRALARENACHPSTILRQVRRFEGRHDDPLIDDALRALAGKQVQPTGMKNKDAYAMTAHQEELRPIISETLTQDRIDKEAKRILRRLCEPQAVLAVAMEMETAVVVRDTDDGGSLRTAVVDREIAQAIALKEWITCPEPTGRINRYFITNAGRAALRKLTAADENRASGFAEKPGMFEGTDKAWKFERETGDLRASRYYATESPLLGLARRKDRDGKPFLCKDLVASGERLREDFELTLIGSKMLPSWEAIIASPQDGSGDGPSGTVAARKRVRDAMEFLGPGLGDVVLSCCCLLEGLEVTEKNLGWSARSGKIVLRIALQRLFQHYAQMGKYAPMIG